MSKKTIKPLSEDFEIVAPLSLEEQVSHNLEIRNNSFYGSAFNALDDYFRKGYAFALSNADYSTEYHNKGNEFTFLIKPTWRNDSTSEDPNETIKSFFYEIYNIVAREELEDVKGLVFCDQDTGFPNQYKLIVTSKYELMQIIEKLLKQYDFENDCMPSVRHRGITEESQMCFSMFPLYSLEHVRTMFNNTQGRGFDGKGLYLNH
jgi:hypothetical protein